jgi:hypothetical protein
LLLSRSLFEGKGYISSISGIDVPVNFYPPGYPSILAIARIFFGENIIAFNILNGGFLIASILILYKVSSKLTSYSSIFISVSVLVILNYHLLRFSTMIMSEMPFLFFSTLSFYFVYKLPEQKFIKSRYLYFLIISLSVSYYIRSIGITILVATLAHYVLNKNWKLALTIFAGFILLYLPWIIRNSIHGIKSRYLGTVMTVNPWQPEKGSIGSVNEFIEKMIDNFNETVIHGFIDSLFPFLNISYSIETTVLFVIWSSIILGITLFGALKMQRLRFLFFFYLLSNIAILMIWHGGNGIRYVIPIIPIIFISFFNGVLMLAKLLLKNDKTVSIFGYSFLIVAILYIPQIEKLSKENEADYPPNYINYINIQ